MQCHYFQGQSTLISLAVKLHIPIDLSHLHQFPILLTNKTCPIVFMKTLFLTNKPYLEDQPYI